MDTKMIYEEFKKEFRLDFPTASKRLMREMHQLVSPDQYTVADTPPPQPTVSQDWSTWWVQQIKEKEEGINPMNISQPVAWPACAPCVETKSYGFKTKAAVANAQIIGAVPMEATQRDYAIERIKAIGEQHAKALRAQFNMDDIHPQTWNELKAFIDAGDFTIDKGKTDAEHANMYNVFYGVTFGKPADNAGYNAAKDTLKHAAQKALDQATLWNVDALEGVIDTFEAWTL